VPSSPNYSPISASARDDGSLEGTLAEPSAPIPGAVPVSKNMRPMLIIF
jgi:hypothetical protein